MWFLKTPNDISFLTKYDLFFVWSHTLKFLCILLPNCRMHISQLTIFNLQFLLSPVRIISYLYGPCTQLPYYIIQLLENARISICLLFLMSHLYRKILVIIFTQIQFWVPTCPHFSFCHVQCQTQTLVHIRAQ